MIEKTVRKIGDKQNDQTCGFLPESGAVPHMKTKENENMYGNVGFFRVLQCLPSDFLSTCVNDHAAIRKRHGDGERRK